MSVRVLGGGKIPLGVDFRRGGPRAGFGPRRVDVEPRDRLLDERARAGDA
jgi:hypothetical protein